MGLGAINAIYQARFNRYLHHRGIKDTSRQRVWAFLGDGEMDEVESLGAIGVAAREERAQILAAGIAVQWALEAQRLLRHDWGVGADVWSVTSWTRREALAADAWNLMHPGRPRKVPYVTSRLIAEPGPVTAVSDWMRAVPDQIAPFVPAPWSSLDTDGFGLSDTRGALRRHFHVDAPSIVLRIGVTGCDSSGASYARPGRARPCAFGSP